MDKRSELLEFRDEKSKSSALHLAANSGHVKIVEFLCNRICEDFPEKQ